MSKKMRACLALALTLGGCGVSPEAEIEPRTYRFDWPKEGIRATIEYRSVQAPPSRTACAGKISIENYGSRNYSVLLFNVNVFSAAKALVATDRFSLSSNLNPGGKAVIPFDPNNPLNPAVITTRFSECPKDMASVDVKLEAF
jgi:hypothetical protein